MTKEVVFLFQYSRNPNLFSSLTGNLAAVFGDEIHTTCCYPEGAPAKVLLSGDLFLQLVEEETASLEGLIPNLSCVLPVTRAIRRESLPLLQTIAKGSTVLVVNETYDLSLQTANSLFEIGFSDITWVPYNPERTDWRRYQGIDVAVTPNEAHLVPPFIKHVLDIGDRYIDTSTMVRIATKLGLDSDDVNSHLLQYSQTMLEPESSITKQYLDNFLQSVILKNYVHKQQEGFLLCDSACRLLYANERMNSILERDLQQSDVTLDELFPNQVDQMMPEDFINDVILIGDFHYAVRKTEIIVSDIKIGFSLTFQDEKSIRDSESDLARKLAKRGLQAKAVFSDIISASPKMQDCISLAKEAAKTDFTVLIEGETGTGKELLAQAIHNTSRRKNNPFVAINCAAMPESLLESELFGYEGGAFTGARRQGKAGLFEQANGGTLFLDEIGDMPASLQALLLRALQEKQIMRIGSDRFINVDARIIAASNKLLSEEVRHNRFRADLYYRLNVLPLRVPALRQRRDDIALLLRHFLGADYAVFTKEQKDSLLSRNWPGNIRQLQNFCNFFRTTRKMAGFFDEYDLSGEYLPASAALPIPDPLPLIDIHTTCGHGIGRSSLLELLHSAGFSVSDSWLRKELARLQAAGYITVGRGRLGSQITEKGKKYLEDR